MKQQVKNIVSSHYLPRLKKYEENHEVLDWESSTAHLARFEVLTSNIQLQNKRLLDVGCGMGDLFVFLQEKKCAIQYTGIDLLPEMIDRAKKAFPKVNFLTGDALDSELFTPGTFDVVYCCGVFNLETGDNWNFLMRGLEVFHQTAKEAVVVSLLDDRSGSPEKQYHYFNIEKVRADLTAKGWNFRIVQGYLNNDFTVIVDQ